MPKYESIDFQDTFWTALDGDFYVSTLGNDISGDGSPKNPYLTVKRAMELAQDNEKIIIGPSEYVFEGQQHVSCPVFTCRLATTTNITISLGGLLTIDQTSTQEGDKVLVWNQFNTVENGIYEVKSGTWLRLESFSNEENMVSGALISIKEGITHQQSAFQFTTPTGFTVNTDALSFVKIASSQSVHSPKEVYKLLFESNLTQEKEILVSGGEQFSLKIINVNSPFYELAGSTTPEVWQTMASIEEVNTFLQSQPNTAYFYLRTSIASVSANAETGYLILTQN